MNGQTGCDAACGGASTEICGGSSRLSVYQSKTQVPPVLVKSISIDQGKTNQTFQGCFIDNNNTNTTLNGYTFTSTKNMTVENCIRGCEAKGYAVSGVEYGTGCYCGTSVPSTTLLASNASCEVMMCSGNTTEFCADSSRLAVYA